MQRTSNTKIKKITHPNCHHAISENDFFYQPFPKRQFLEFSKLKEFADDSLKWYENGRKFSK